MDHVCVIVVIDNVMNRYVTITTVAPLGEKKRKYCLGYKVLRNCKK